MSYLIKRAYLGDLEDMLSIVEVNRERLANRGIPQWQNGEGPNADSLRQCIKKEEAYILVNINDGIVGMGTLERGEQPGYASLLSGSWDGTDYVSIHKVCLSPGIKEPYQADYLLHFFIEKAKQEGWEDIRIDTHPLNLPMQGVIERVGFKKMGEIKLPVNHGERLAYQYVSH